MASRRRRRGRPGQGLLARRHQRLDLLAGHRAAEIGQRPSGLEHHRPVVVHVVHHEDALPQRREDPVHLRAVEGVPRGGRRPLQALEHPVLVALGLQPADEPRPGVGEPLVVEVHRVLRRQHDAQAVGARLLEQGEHRQLRRRVGGRGEVAEDLVHVEDGAQARGPRLRPGPGQHLVEEDRDEEHPLGVGEMSDRDDRQPRLARAAWRAARRRPAAPPPARRRTRARPAGCSASSPGRSGPWPGRTSPGRGRRPSGTAATGRHGSARPCPGCVPRARRGRGRWRAGCARGWRSGRRRRPRAPAAPRRPRRSAGDRPRAVRPGPAAARRTSGARSSAARRSRPACRSPGPPPRGTARSARRPRPRRPAPRATVSAVLAANSSRVSPLRPASSGSTHGRKSVGPQLGEPQQQVAQVPLGVDGDRRDAVDRRLLQERDPQPRLAAAGHAHADGVRRQVLRIVEQLGRARSPAGPRRIPCRGRTGRASRSPA